MCRYGLVKENGLKYWKKKIVYFFINYEFIKKYK